MTSDKPKWRTLLFFNLKEDAIYNETYTKWMAKFTPSLLPTNSKHYSLTVFGRPSPSSRYTSAKSHSKSQFI